MRSDSCCRIQLEIVKCISEEEYLKKGMDCMASSKVTVRPLSSNILPLKKPLWAKKREAKMAEAHDAEAEENACTPNTLPRGQAPAHASRAGGVNMCIDPSREGAYLLNGHKEAEHQVCVDPFIGIKLKPHQVEGVKFMYGNLTKNLEQPSKSRLSDSNEVQGCILADEMGLGKTIQTIALMWTVLKQSPVSKTSPLVRKCVVVCPSSLVFNWQNECKHWLGDQRLQTLAVVKGGKMAQDTVDEFVLGGVKPVLMCTAV